MREPGHYPGACAGPLCCSVTNDEVSVIHYNIQWKSVSDLRYLVVYLYDSRLLGIRWTGVRRHGRSVW